jgi:hypothetical protein
LPVVAGADDPRVLVPIPRHAETRRAAEIGTIFRAVEGLSPGVVTRPEN